MVGDEEAREKLGFWDLKDIAPANPIQSTSLVLSDPCLYFDPVLDKKNAA